MSASEIEACLWKDFAFLLLEHDCALRHVLLESLRSCLKELDALDRTHPIWAKSRVQVVSYPVYYVIVDSKLQHNPDDEMALWCDVAFDLKAGSCISIVASESLERSSPRWQGEWLLAQAFFNYYLFGPQRWLEELREYLVRRERLEWALRCLRDPAFTQGTCVRWLLSELEEPIDEKACEELIDWLLNVVERAAQPRPRQPDRYSESIEKQIEDLRRKGKII